ncbi:glycosyltransferase [Kineococcus sp. SYSU DK004]|uniref:glycosyltransferase n=1 Tax=Kineococcus sp. SYSU DK004 TaxID=3383125 RepID=UPI003D7DE18C
MSTTRTALPALVAAAFAGHVAYPAWLLAHRPRRAGATAIGAADAGPVGEHGWTWEDVDVLVPAHGEAGVILQTLRTLVDACRVPLSCVTVVVDEDERTRDLCLAHGFRVDYAERRAGKAAAVNRGVDGTKAPYVVVVDANATLDQDGLRALLNTCVARYDLVSGLRRERGAADEGLYWRYENWIKTTEAARGGSLALVGEAVAFRRPVFRPIPAGTANDDLWLAFDVASRGYAVGVEPRCLVVEDSAPRGDQLERRVRIMAGQLRLFWRYRAQFATGPVEFRRFAAHKVWRSTVGPAAQVALLAGAAAAPRRRTSQLVLAGHALAVLAYARGDRLHGRASAPLRLAGQAVGMPLVVFCRALPRAVRGQSGVWTKRMR